MHWYAKRQEDLDLSPVIGVENCFQQKEVMHELAAERAVNSCERNSVLKESINQRPRRKWGVDMSIKRRKQQMNLGIKFGLAFRISRFFCSAIAQLLPIQAMARLIALDEVTYQGPLAQHGCQ